MIGNLELLQMVSEFLTIFSFFDINILSVYL